MTVEGTRQLDTRDLEARMKAMYEEVARTPPRWSGSRRFSR